MSFQSLSIQDQISLLESVLDERRAATQSQSVIKNGVYVDLVKNRHRHRSHYRPVPKRGTWGNDILGPQNPDRARQEPDIVLPPVTDAGKMPNMKW